MANNSELCNTEFAKKRKSFIVSCITDNRGCTQLKSIGVSDSNETLVSTYDAG